MSTSSGGGNTNNTRFNVKLLVDKYAMYAVGLLGSLGALIAAYIDLDNRASLLTGAGVIALVTLFSGNNRAKLGLRILGMVSAGICLVAAFLMPGLGMLTAAGTIAGLSIFLTAKD